MKSLNEYISSDNELNENKRTTNKIFKELEFYLGSFDGRFNDKNEFLYGVREVLKYSLIDANFDELVEKVNDIFNEAIKNDPRDLSSLYQKKGEEIAEMVKWDAYDIIDGFVEYLTKKIGKKYGDKLKTLKDFV